MNAAIQQMFQPMNSNRLFTEGPKGQAGDFKQLIEEVLQNADEPHVLLSQMEESGVLSHELIERITTDDELIEAINALLNNESLMSLLVEANAEDLIHQLQQFIDGDVLISSDVIDELVYLLEGKKDQLDEATLSIIDMIIKQSDEAKSALPNEEDYPSVDMDIRTDNDVQLGDQLEASLMQLLTQIEDVLKQMHQGERMENVARQLLPLLKEWSAMNKQLPNEQFRQLVASELDAEDLDILKKVQKLYESRTHFQTKNMYGNNASVTRSDVAQWLTAALNDQAEPTERVIPVLNREQMIAPRMSIVNQQAIYNSNMASVQRVESEITQRIVTQIQQNMLLQANAPQQSLSVRLAPEHLGTLNIQFTQVNGEMLVRIMTNSLVTKEVLEANLQQLKHAFSPHQVQIVHDDTEIDEEIMSQQEEQLAEDEKREQEEQLEEQFNEEPLTIDFTSLIEELLEEEVEIDD